MKDHLKKYMKLCKECNFGLEILVKDDTLFKEVAEDEVCDCCGKKGKTIVLNVTDAAKYTMIRNLQKSLKIKEKFRVRICGCRDFNNYELLKKECEYFLQEKLPNVTVVSGGGRGADRLGEMFAKEHNLELEIYRPDWDADGRSAGPKNNEMIVKKVDGVIAFWDGKSRGTKSTIDFCKQYGVKCKIIKIEREE